MNVVGSAARPVRQAIAVQEARRAMRRFYPLIAAMISLSPACGCGGLGWYQAVGHIPGVARTDYAYYDFWGTSSQLFQFSPPQVESSTIEALGDLGFTMRQPPLHEPTGNTLIRARTPDGRPADINITPQNAMTNVRVEIGPAHIGDFQSSRELLRRIALNFGTGIRAYTPVETTVPRRINMSPGIPPTPSATHPLALQGEGLRPNESRDKALKEEEREAGTETAPPTNQPSPFAPYPGFVPTRDFPNPPNMPYAPFPYTPFNDGSQN